MQFLPIFLIISSMIYQYFSKNFVHRFLNPFLKNSRSPNRGLKLGDFRAFEDSGCKGGVLFKYLLIVCPSLFLTAAAPKTGSMEGDKEKLEQGNFHTYTYLHFQ